ncbi:hypothetical protein [Kitasatospora sp. NPDC005856]|uniref:VMAP-C domain-containing protein n=1 Tax=Kitasatospora sp. NPDC005856 TaxID=3154566 RepID=UPI0033F13CC5
MAGLTADPARVHAIVVGLEGYPGAALDGPVADALAFVAWLRGHGVPPGNIALWLFPRDRNRDAAERAARDHRVPVSWATTDDSTRLMDTLRDPREGDVLYVYWAGHGVTAQQDRRLLMLPSDPDRTARWLHTQEFYEVLSDPAVCRFRHQVFLLDVCATYAERRLDGEPVPLSFGAYRRTVVPQFVIHATATDQVALEADGRGRFSRTVVDWLAAQDALLPDLPGLADHLADRFPPDGDGQTPTVLVRDWDLNVREHRPAPAAPEPDRALSESLRKELHSGCDGLPPGTTDRLAGALRLRRTGAADSAEQLAGVLLRHRRALATLLDVLGPADRHRARRLLRVSAFLHLHHHPVRVLSDAEHQRISDLLGALPALTTREVARALAAPPAADPATAPDGLGARDLALWRIDVLDRLPLRFRGGSDSAPLLPPVVEALEALAVLPSAAPVAQEVRRLAERVVERLTISSEVLDHVRATAEQRAARPDREPRVVVRLERYDEDGKFLCYVSVDRGDGQLTLVSEGSDVPCDQHEVVERILLANRSLGPAGGGSEQLIEVVLDNTDLDLDVADWRGGPDDGLPTVLGWEYPVVIRSVDVRAGEAEVRRRWDARNAAPVRLRDADAADLGFYRTLVHQRTASRALVQTGPPDRVRAAQVAIAVGYPIVCWDAGATAEVPDAHFDPLDPAGEPEDLPERVRACRCDPPHTPPAPRRPVLVWQHPGRPLDHALTTTRHT